MLKNIQEILENAWVHETFLLVVLKSEEGRSALNKEWVSEHESVKLIEHNVLRVNAKAECKAGSWGAIEHVQDI